MITALSLWATRGMPGDHPTVQIMASLLPVTVFLDAVLGIFAIFAVIVFVGGK